MTGRVSGRTFALLLPLALLLGLLAGCSGQTPKSPRAESGAKVPGKALSAGSCWDDEQLPEALGPEAFKTWVHKYAGGNAVLGDAMRDDAAFTHAIACNEPHSLELYNVIELDPVLTAQVKQYADLLDQKSALYRRIRDQVNDRCLAHSPYGLAQRRAGGLPVQLGPSLSTVSGLRVAWDPFPANLWARGQKRFVCTFEQDHPGTLRFADLTTTRTPVAARVCLDTPGRYLPCQGRHQAEDIAEMILNTAIENGQVNGRKALRKGPKGAYVALSDAEYSRLDKVCQTFLSAVSSSRNGVQARAYPGAVSQWPTDVGVYVASCFALKPSTPPPPVSGTVFDRR
jgi:hypothetical protein